MKRVLLLLSASGLGFCHWGICVTAGASILLLSGDAAGLSARCLAALACSCYSSRPAADGLSCSSIGSSSSSRAVGGLSCSSSGSSSRPPAVLLLGVFLALLLVCLCNIQLLH